MSRSHVLCLILLCTVITESNALPLLVEANLDEWSASSLVGETHYKPIVDIEQGVVIRAVSDSSASGYHYFHKIDLLKTPILKWLWTAEQTPVSIKIDDLGIERRITAFDETLPQGDDFVLRMSVGRSPLFGDKKTLHYVWSANQLIGSHWAPSEHTRVLVVSGEQQVIMKWQTQLRNIQKDWLELFGENINSIDFVAFMTDSDSIQGQAAGYYGDIQTLAEPVLASGF